MLAYIRSTTARLAASYLAIIMAMSIGFSVVIYHISTHELGRQVPSRVIRLLTEPDYFNTYLQQRYDESRHALIAELILLNLVMLVAGAFISHVLARRTLRPIEAAMDAQTRFSADASHELRTPLTAIRTSNEVALRKPKLTLAQAKQVIGSNLAEVTRLERLAEGLLKLSRGNSISFKIEPVWLGEVANDAMNQVLAVAQAKSINIDDTVPKIQVSADRAAVVQAVTALLDNAIKYSDKGKTVYLSGQQKNGFGFLSIRDQGPGIKASHLPYIFERFYRADHSRSHQVADGYGLGLSIAKKTISQLGGDITAASRLGDGSTFTVKLPLAKTAN